MNQTPECRNRSYQEILRNNYELQKLNTLKHSDFCYSCYMTFTHKQYT
jgi:hypothetical protein